MTDERVRELFAESASASVGKLIREGDAEAMQVYAEALKRVAADMNAKGSE